MNAPAAAHAGAVVAVRSDDDCPPGWNGDLAAGALRWCGRNDAPHFCRLLLVSLALIADDNGLIGAVTDREICNLTGLTHAVARAHRVWLTRRGAIEEIRRPGLSAVLWLTQAVIGSVPTADLMDSAARPVTGRRSRCVARRDADAHGPQACTVGDQS
jgi:hypothetical protein